MAPRSNLNSLGFLSFLATQFLGAFNDNAFKLVVTYLALSTLPAGKDSSYIATAGVLFMAPFVVFSAYAGYLADRFSKTRVMIFSKVAEILIMGLGMVFLGLRNLHGLLAVLFLMASQSAFFSPAKYGFLPEYLGDEDLSRGNGRVQLWTFVAIILGTAAGGVLFSEFRGSLHWAGLAFVGIAVLGTLTSLGIGRVPAAGSGVPFTADFVGRTVSTVREMYRDRPLFLCLLGTTFFWFCGALFQMNIQVYGKHHMGLSEVRSSLLLTSLALGIGVGSALAGRWSGRQVEFGLVPLGAMGLGAFAVCLSFSHYSYILTLVVVHLLGLSAGLYELPLNAFIQQRSPADGKGRMLAATNVVTFAGMMVASGVLWLYLNALGGLLPQALARHAESSGSALAGRLAALLPRLISPATLFLVMGLASFVVIAQIVRLLPDFLLRFVLWVTTHTLYRVRVLGAENLPREGPALLVCNHVSYADGALLQACTQRFIRHVIERSWYERRLFRPFLRLLGTISVPTEAGPKAVLQALREASEYLRRGELVCLFAEGSITRTGNLLGFNRGLERVMEGVDAPIIPVYLDRVWGSIFSFEGGRVLRRLPARLPYPVTVLFGAPLPARSRAWEVRSAVAELSVEAFRLRTNEHELLSTRFFHQARRVPLRFCMADSGGRELTYWRACVMAMALSRVLRRRCPGEEMVGVLLPTGVPAALVNIALTMLGKCPVNLNYTAPREAQDRAVAKCGIRHIVTARAFLARLGVEPAPAHLMAEDLAAEATLRDRLLSLAGFALLPHCLLRRLFREDRRRTVHSVATVMFSSGSTGDPKGVMLTHANIHANIEGLYQTLDLRAGDKVLGVLPFFHSFGLTGTLWLPLTSGLGAVYHSNPLDAKAVGELGLRWRPTVLAATPTFLMGYLRKCDAGQFASLRYVVTGAEKLTERLARAFYEKFHIEPLEGYGCTELSPIVAVNRPDFVSPGLRQKGLKPGTIGQPLPGIAVRIADPETGETLPPGRDGVLLVKGANVMLGYIGDEALTREVLRDGWYVTGDLASMDADGFITIRDRLSRFSKIGGEMVPHVRIEEEIHALLDAGGERVCVVTGVPDEKKGEALAVLYRGELDPAAVRAGLAARGIPNLWIPKADFFWPVDEIPVLGTGKLDLRRVKALAAERAAALAASRGKAAADKEGPG